MNIPRYTASYPLQTQFVTNADATGDMVFTQLKRTNDVAVYKRERNGKVFCYEVVVIKTVKAGTVFAKGAKPTEKDYESYPGGKSFGKSGWACADEVRAFEKFDEVVKNHQPEVTYTFPAGDFNLIDFAKVNNLPVDKTTAGLVGSLLQTKAIVFKGVVGKVQMFRKG